MLAPGMRQPALVRSRSGWARRWPPLLVLGAALALAILTLPSSLLVPQTNPGQTVEYAPVPGDSPAPNQGNLAALGLGTGAGPGGLGGLGSGVGLSQPPAGTGAHPSSKDCVGNPPRQTEDPLSPPCVAFFVGDNGGGTYSGVTRNEIRIVYYADDYVESSGEKYAGMTFDVNQHYADEPDYVKMLRAFETYFNGRYQTYGRLVHFFLHVAPANAPTAEQARADAAADIADFHPFAALTSIRVGDEVAYHDMMAQHGVLSFGFQNLEPASVFSAFPGLIWSYHSTIDYEAMEFARLLCREVWQRPVSFAGDPRLIGSPRKLGLLYPNNTDQPGMALFTDEVRSDFKSGCGGTFAVEHSFDAVGYTVNPNPDDAPTATQNMADFDAQHVTTIVWTQGFNVTHTAAAAKLGYYPEWVVAGDGALDGNGGNVSAYGGQEQTEWAHAWVMSQEVVWPPIERTYCYQAAETADPSDANSTATGGGNNAAYFCNLFTLYDDLRQLFTGIQVAGPRLTPASIDEGFHAIPAVPSGNPALPACFYPSGDYTCVKDAITEWWDPSYTDPQDVPGCWRAPESGRRFIGGDFPEVDINSRKDTSRDPCNGFYGSWAE